MKNLITILLLMAPVTAFGQNGKATTTKKTFSRATTVSISIDSDPAIIWALLTNAADFPRWNSTVTDLKGNIRLGEKIRLKSILDPKRTFKIKVKVFQPETMMVWGDGLGKRTFLLEKKGEQKVVFTMTEKLGSPMFPLFAGKIPPFDEVFEQFAEDLKKEAEAIMKAK